VPKPFNDDPTMYSPQSKHTTTSRHQTNSVKALKELDAQDSNEGK